MTLTLHGLTYRVMAPHWFELVGAPLIIAMDAERRWLIQVRGEWSLLAFASRNSAALYVADVFERAQA